MREREVQFEDFEKYFPYTPTALCIKECARLSVLRHHACPSPILDVGSGDGLFAKIAYSGAEVWGIDIDAKESRWAQASQAYSQIIIGDVTRAGLPESFFGSAVANCSLEHIPDLQSALRTILRSLKPGARAFLFVPNRDWASHFLSVRALKTVGAKAASTGLENAINRVFKHHHLYDEAGWGEQVRQAGFALESTEPVLSTATTVGFEAFLAPSIAGWVNKRLTTRWTNFPGLRQFGSRPTYSLVQAVLRASDKAPTAEFLVVARRPG